MSDIQDRINGTTHRADNLLNVLGRREIERQAAEEAEREEARRVRIRDNAERRRQYQVRYSDAYQSFGTVTPAPIDNELAGEYRKRLYEGLRRKLPSDHEWASVRADDIPPSAGPQIERMVIEAAMREGLRPSAENLPASGELVRRERTDQMSGAKSIEWLGRELVH